MQEAVVMTVPAKLVTDTEAIALYVADGNPREDWAALDDRDRWPWRKMALVPAHGLEPRFTASKADVLPLDEAGVGAARRT
jgi:glutathione S-transferase